MALHTNPVSILLAILMLGILAHLYRPFRGQEVVRAVDHVNDETPPVIYRFRESDPVFKDALRKIPSLKDDSINPELDDSSDTEKNDTSAGQPPSGTAGSTSTTNNDDKSNVVEEELSLPETSEHSYLDYRNHLISSPHSPLTYGHTESLGFSNIYVVSLPTRSDRRKRMSDIAAALGARVTFIDATSTSNNISLINWIGERVLEVRKQKRTILSQVLGVDEEKVGGMNVDCIWLARPESRLPNMDAYAFAHPENSPEPVTQLPKLPSLADDRWNGSNWAARLDKADRENDHHELIPDDLEFDVKNSLWDSIETIPSRQIVPAVIATWHSHMKAVKSMIQNGDDSALILEDDVDIEWDIERMWSTISHRIGLAWDMSFLGHCWGREATYPSRVHPNVYNSDAPRCLHGYAVTKAGAQKLVEMTSDPWIAFQAPIDTAVPSFVLQGLVKAYSLEPPLIIQGKDSPSDIQPGSGSVWRGLLMDSTLERIWRDEGREVLEMSYDDSIQDPAVVRPKIEEG